jgi:hypothetical protein
MNAQPGKNPSLVLLASLLALAAGAAAIVVALIVAVHAL